MAIPQEINECDNESTERLNRPDNNDENGNGQSGDNENQNHEPVEGCGPKKFYYVSLVVNGIFLGLVLCILVLYLVRGNDDYKDDLQSSKSAHPPPEDSFFSCSPCEPLVRTVDANTMRLFMRSSSMLCCKLISPVVKVQVSKVCEMNDFNSEE